MAIDPSKRREARILAMQSLCQWDAQPDDREALLAEYLQTQTSDDQIFGYAQKLAKAVWQYLNNIDELISISCQGWTVSRIAMVEPNILRIAAAELQLHETPHKVVINEAIEIGRSFGGKDSPGFVNGVLDEVYRRMSDTGEET